MSSKCERHPGDELELEHAYFLRRTEHTSVASIDCDDYHDSTLLYDELRAELGAPVYAESSEPAIEIPSALDAALRAAAACSGARIREQNLPEVARPRSTSSARWIAVGVAVCAAAAIVLAVLLGGTSETPEVAQRSTSIAGDINGDGRTDVIDALLLARALPASSRASSGKLPPIEKAQRRWDTDGDGAIDEADVEWILRTAVTLEVSKQ